MATLQSDPAPTSEALTHNVRVEVLSRYVPENSRQSEWVFEYTIRISNVGTDTVRLLSRHWIITDALERVREVKGDGVVGKQPVLAPGESFIYSSWCPLETPTGVMQGSYRMVDSSGNQLQVEIAPFALRAPYRVQ